MNVLMVVHQFLPRHLAGSEVYTYHLTQALRARGHRVELFFTEIRPRRPQYELRQGQFEGIPFFEAVHNRTFPSFRHSYRDLQMESLFRRVLDATTPDLVHVQHLHLHSIGYIDIARRRDLPVVYTLHEYMLICLNGGLLLRSGATLCPGPEPAACARCAAPMYPAPRASLWSRLASGAEVLPLPIRRVAAKLRTVLESPGPKAVLAVPPDGQPYVEAVRLREVEIRSELAKVALFLAPSRFLRQRFIAENLVSPDRIVYSDYGLVANRPAPRPPRRPPPLRVGYVGTIAEHKGVHLIVEAFREIREPGIECRIYGDVNTFPDYRERLLAGGTPPAIRFMGGLENATVVATLAQLDVLIVPSIWFENSPLTIHEAYLAGTPVLTANEGGMAELVEDGRTGLHFRLGDAADLRRQLLRLLREPGLLESLRMQLPSVKTIEEDAAQMEARYQILLDHRIPVS